MKLILLIIGPDIKGAIRIPRITTKFIVIVGVQAKSIKISSEEKQWHSLHEYNLKTFRAPSSLSIKTLTHIQTYLKVKNYLFISFT